ncbi:terminase [Lysinibacillus mangiferihumi]|uniref:Terminase n=1 Tax=Lysinibacillus mangiferihumi TaxID=1130819 RepID=A0A4U2ZFG7_9BACI|nr:phage terminase small subunit [Lysinibacillus mangiferihumi]TKI72632.1 terminase [Lysinibacillus mangiferihumi]
MAEKYQLAYQDYKSGMKQKDIAAKYNVSINTVKSWQQRKWRGMDNANEKVCTPNEKSMHTKKGAPRGNQNAVGNTGGAPLNNQNAKGNRGGSAPQGNKNAVTTGEYESLMWDYLDEEERELYGTIETDPLFQIDRNVRELTIRQRRMMKRIKAIEQGLTEKQRRELQQLRKVKEAATGADGQTVTIAKERMVTVEVEETIFRKMDDILNLEEALTRVTSQLVRAIKQKHDIEKSNSEQQWKLKQMKLHVKKTKVEIENLKGGDKNQSAEDWVAALNEVAEKRKVNVNE